MDSQRIYTATEIKEKLLPIFRSLPIEKAILFGSYAKGNATHHSDIDLLIDSKGQIKGIDFFGVLEDITEALQVPIDLIEASQLLSDGKVQQEIAQSGLVIYERA